MYTTKFNGKYLTKVETDDVKIIFELSSTQSERLDLKGDNITSGYGAKRLNAVHIWDKINNRLLKSYKFAYEYFGYDPNFTGAFTTLTDPLSKRLKLKSIKEIGYDQNGNEIATKPAYSFEYNETHLLPRKDAFARDHWGYFNGQSNNTSFLPNITNDLNSTIASVKDYFNNTYPDYVINDLKAAGQANKGMNAEFAQSGLLNKLTYPTGAYTAFEYEANRFKNYRVFSASEISNMEGIISGSVVDMNTSGSVIMSANLYPDENGKLNLNDFKAIFTRVNPTINSSFFLNARIRVKKTTQLGIITTLNEWFLTTQELPIFEQNNTFTFGSFNLFYSGISTDHYNVEAYLPDIPELTPVGSSIPVATASAIFVVPDYATKLKESIGGGLRIKSITNKSYVHEFIDKKIFKYLLDDGTTISGKLMSPVKNYSYLNGYTVTLGSGGGRIRYKTELYDLSSYSYVPASSDAQGQSVGYDRVEVLSVDQAGIDNGKIAYSYFNTPSSVLAPSTISFAKGTPNIPFYNNGLLKSEEIYIKNSLTPVKEKLYNYISLKSETKRYPIIYDLATGAYSNEFCLDNCAHNYPGTFDEPIGKWISIIYPLNTKWFAPSTITDIDYSFNPAGQITNQKNFEYNSFGQVIKEENINSKGQTVRSLTTYPIDVVSPPSIVQLMKTKKLYHLPLEQIVTLTKLSGTQEISKVSYNYIQTSSSNINLNNAQKSLGGNTSFDLATNILYDTKDNIVEFNKNGMFTSYIWNDLQNHKIAEVSNAVKTNIAFTSFEENSNGNWTGINNVNIINTAQTVTGKEYYQGMFTITKSSLDPSLSYIISYWSKNGSYNANGTLGIQGRSFNGWVYYEHLVSSPSGGVISVTGNGAIDELRLYPSVAQMSTYSYNGLIGITSANDINNRVSYYEYDAYNRLVVIRDQDKNILKTFCYNYAGQVEDCNICTSTIANWQNTLSPPRCQLSSPCAYTGYQEQEQRDMNVCSPTYNQAQWIVAGYNPTACTPGTYVTITHQTPFVTGFTAVYYNITTGVTYTFNIPAGNGTLGCVPAGNYLITISKPGNTNTYMFGIGSCRISTGTSATFKNVAVSSSGCNTITINLDLED